MWQKDAVLDVGTRRLVAVEKQQELLNFHGNPKSTRKLAASGNSDIDDIGTTWPHNLHISTASVTRLRYGRRPGDKMEDLDVNTIIWRMFISVTLQTTVHLGKRIYIPSKISSSEH